TASRCTYTLKRASSRNMAMRPRLTVALRHRRHRIRGRCRWAAVHAPRAGCSGAVAIDAQGRLSPPPAQKRSPYGQWLFWPLGRLSSPAHRAILATACQPSTSSCDSTRAPAHMPLPIVRWLPPRPNAASTDSAPAGAGLLDSFSTLQTSVTRARDSIHFYVSTPGRGLLIAYLLSALPRARTRSDRNQCR